MPYGETQRLVKDRDDVILVESAFKETTRSGSLKSSVLLALTKKKLLIVSRKLVHPQPRIYYNILESELPLSNVNLTIFKQTRRQVLKARFFNETVKYYELGNFKKRKIFWEIWRNHVRELNRGPKLWPFKTSRVVFQTSCAPTPTTTPKGSDTSSDVLQKEDRARWTDKYLYLGSKRELEDSIQPVPALTGFTQMPWNKVMEEVVGCTQSNHWMMSDQSLGGFRPDNPVCTYTGEPTSNVTYVSILTIMREIDDSSSRL